MPLGEFLEIFDRVHRRRRQFLLRIIEHSERIFGDGARTWIAPVALGVLLQRGAEEQRLLRPELGERARPEAVDLPVFPRRDRYFERGTAIPVEQQPPER